jgi:hypothetical protein
MANAQALDDPTLVGSSAMRTTKISITLDTELLEEIRTYARGNLSRYVNEALRDKLRNEHLRELVEEYVAVHGPIPQELLAQAEVAFRAAEEGWERWQRG